MRLVADECIERPVVEALRGLGHDVVHVPEQHQGITDNEVLALANDLASVLLTGDKDFGELVYRLGRASGGVVLIRLHGQSNDQKIQVVSQAFVAHDDEFVDAFTVITPTSIRIRRPDQDDDSPDES